MWLLAALKTTHLLNGTWPLGHFATPPRLREHSHRIKILLSEVTIISKLLILLLCNHAKLQALKGLKILRKTHSL